MDSIKGGALQLAAAFGVAFSVGAVVSFGKELLRMGDEIVRVADRTGLTTKEVQQLSYVAGQSGNTIDELTAAIGKLQNGLASGDKSAVGAVKELGLNFAALMAASPADQMEQIATAIAKIPDPAERTRIAMDLFGKSGTAILPTLTSQFAALRAEAPVMSDATVKALDQAGDQLAKFGQQLKVWAAESYNYAGKAFDAIVKAAYNAIAAFSEMTLAVIKGAEKIPGMSRVLTTLGVDTAEMTANAQWFRDAANAMGVEVEGATPKVAGLGGALKETGVQTAEATRAADAFRAAMEELNSVGGSWYDTVIKIDGEVVEAVKYYLAAGVSQNTLATAYALTASQVKAISAALANELAAHKSLDEFRTLAAARMKEIQTAMLKATNDQVLADFNAAQQKKQSDAEFLAGALKDAQAQDTVNFSMAQVPAAAGAAAGAVNGLTNSYWAAVDAAAALSGIPSIGTRPPSLESPGFSSPGFGGGGLHPLTGLHPLSGVSSAASASVVNHIYVNGTAEEAARKISDQVTRTLMQSTKLVPS